MPEDLSFDLGLASVKALAGHFLTGINKVARGFRIDRLKEIVVNHVLIKLLTKNLSRIRLNWGIYEEYKMQFVEVVSSILASSISWSALFFGVALFGLAGWAKIPIWTAYSMSIVLSVFNIVRTTQGMTFGNYSPEELLGLKFAAALCCALALIGIYWASRNKLVTLKSPAHVNMVKKRR